MRLMHVLLVLVLAVLAGTAAQAQTFPELTGRVVDAAELLSPEQEAQIVAMSEQTETATGRQLVVATIPDLQGYAIDDYGYRLASAWQMGRKDADNGILLIVAPNERAVRIEVGKGLEPIITDGLAGLIIDNEIIPRFRAKDMGGGVVAGATAINEQLKLPLEAAEARAKQLLDSGKRRKRDGGGWIVALFWVAILLFVILPIIVGAARGKKYRRGRAPVVIWGPGWGSGSGSSWGGGGSSWGGGGGGSSWGGGGFSGGGGSFGGGGASGGW